MKQCTRCGQTKSLDDFYKHSMTKDKRQGHCKVCAKMTARKHRIKKRKGAGSVPQSFEPFSTDRTCQQCSNTVHWTKFYLDAQMCKDCWRKYLSTETEVGPYKDKKPSDGQKNMNALLKVLATKTDTTS